MQLETPTVCCAILTFNRLSSLKDCLSGVLSQTRTPDSILVVDNGSSQETKAYLDDESSKRDSLSVERLNENVGPAGGYAHALRWAAEKNYSYCWVMDDDVFARPDCLAGLLLDLDGSENRIVFPRTFGWNGDVQVYPAWAGVLIPVSIIKRAGLPREELFWWTEDTEYLQWRLPKIFGVELVFSTRGIVNHGVDDGKEKPAWKYYYEARNTIYYRLYVQEKNVFRRAWKTVRTLIKLTGRAIVLEDEKLVKLRLITAGVFHGVQKKLGKRIDPEKQDPGWPR